jgi:hypothetical protein
MRMAVPPKKIFGAEIPHDAVRACLEIAVGRWRR